MPRRDDLESILIIGAGPIVIGQACEFDYSGAQACKALTEEGYRVILVNSNPATIMTDPEMADAVYIEPVNWRTVARIIEKERPSALLPTMGGQTALNCALDLAREGVLEKYNVELIAASREAIDMAEDRELFRKAMREVGLDVPRARIAHSMEEALAVQAEIGYPTVIRPSFTLGGSGGGIAYNREEFEEIVARGLDASPTNEVLLEESVLGWKEFEMEEVRDHNDNCIIVCSIENLDPMGVHTGDSITVAPAQTLTDKEYERMRNASIAVLRKIGVDTGGSNVQFAINPDDGRMLIIEMNPRVSRSSALASKATGFPIAKVAAKLAVGYTLDELKNEITGGATPASFEPTIDYVVTKIPRFTFEKFPAANTRLTTQMKSVGEVMAMGRTFQESLHKALRSLETGCHGLDEQMALPLTEETSDALAYELGSPGANRLLYVADAFRAGWPLERIASLTHIDPWFLANVQDLVEEENRVRAGGLEALDAARIRGLKRKGFSDKRLATLLGIADEAVIGKRRQKLGVRPVYKRVDTCAAEFGTTTAYMYSTYEEECEAAPSDRRKIMILGGGPNRIGQGIEFDYCCVHAALALREDGFETIMVNCNPETVSTDYDTSDRLYFEPLTFEDVMEIIALEKPEGVIVQFGGQTPLKLSRALAAAGAPIIGTTPDSIDIAEDRERFQQLVKNLGLKQPANATARTEEQAVQLAREVGFPLVVRPSYVRQPRTARSLPRSRRRSGRRCRERRRQRADRWHHGTRRTGRRAFGRLGLLAAAQRAERATAAGIARPDAPAREGAQRRRPHERAVRDPERHRVRARGQSARFAHRAVRGQGDRRAARQGCGAGDDRPQAPGARLHHRAHPGVLLGQGSRVPVHQVPGSRPDPRSRDEINRRGDGHGSHLRRGLRQGAIGLGRDPADARRVPAERARS
jgi:carbamoyl-phosphate synthase large subunit